MSACEKTWQNAGVARVNTPVAPVSTQRFSTASWAPHEGLPAWREIYGQSVAKLEFEPEPGEELFAEAALRQFPGLSLVSMASTGLHFRKSPSLLGDDGYILAIIDSGRWTGSQFGREA